MARVCVDSDFFALNPDGSLTFHRDAVGLRQMLVLAAPGTSQFAKADYPGLTRLRVRVVGGGGGGAGADAQTGECVARAGGGGGGYSESVLNASDLGASETITVGQGGAGGAGGDDGTNGEASSFGGFLLARGGPGSTQVMPSGTNADARSGSPGASPGTGQIAVAGGSGGGCFRMNATAGLGGAGGDAGGGMGQGGLARAIESAGADGRGHGGGGGGASSRGAAFSGGNGSPGLVLVELYF